MRRDWKEVREASSYLRGGAQGAFQAEKVASAKALRQKCLAYWSKLRWREGVVVKDENREEVGQAM